MEINLRRAAAIQAAIRETLGRTGQDPSMHLSIFETDIQGAMAGGVAKFLESHARRTSLVEVLYALRKKVANANAASGITDLLGDQALITQKIDVLSAIVAAAPAEDVEIIRKRSERSANRDESKPAPYGRSGYADTILVGLLSEAVLKDYMDQRRALERKKVENSDKLAELNSSTRISLEDTHEQFLRAEGLI